MALSDGDSVKVAAFFVMFIIIMITGNVPLRVKAFRQNLALLSFSAAFSGGLFMSVGILHLLPDSIESFQTYYDSISISQQNIPDTQNQIEDNEQSESQPPTYFPWPFWITIISFALILCIEKIIFQHSHGHDHNHGHNKHYQNKDVHNNNKKNKDKKLKTSQTEDKVIEGQNGVDLAGKDIESLKKININNEMQPLQNGEQNQSPNQIILHTHQVNQDPTLPCNDKKCEDSMKYNEELTIDEQKKIDDQIRINYLAPFLLQIAVGIHAFLEGIAIGIETNYSSIVGITVAVVCHKWAEGYTLGIAFRTAQVGLKMSTFMIFLQALSNPIGIGIGWALSQSGPLVTGIFESISAGTFIYIATQEVLVEEFNKPRYKWAKFFLMLIAIGFVSSIYFIEQSMEA